MVTSYTETFKKCLKKEKSIKYFFCNCFAEIQTSVSQGMQATEKCFKSL